MPAGLKLSPLGQRLDEISGRSGRPPIASPITDSLAVAWYSSAVSTQLTPDSIAAAMAARAAGTSAALSPSSNPPRPIADSSMPVVPTDAVRTATTIHSAHLGWQHVRDPAGR